MRCDETGAEMGVPLAFDVLELFAENAGRGSRSPCDYQCPRRATIGTQYYFATDHRICRQVFCKDKATISGCYCGNTLRPNRRRRGACLGYEVEAARAKFVTGMVVVPARWPGQEQPFVRVPIQAHDVQRRSISVSIIHGYGRLRDHENDAIEGYKELVWPVDNYRRQSEPPLYFFVFLVLTFRLDDSLCHWQLHYMYIFGHQSCSHS